MQVLTGLLAISFASGAWVDRPRYGQGYVESVARPARCVPCDAQRNSDLKTANSNALEYRGNGADNLGYDWSPKAWGGPAFPTKSTDKVHQPDQDWGSRGGRRMPGSWDDKCRECMNGRPEPGRDWDRYTERPGEDGRDGRPDGWRPSTDRPKSWRGSEPPLEVATVTSSVLGVRLRDDKRLPVEWPGANHNTNMRWDGFRNGMPWDRPVGQHSTDQMDRRSDGDDLRPWDGTGRGVAGWDRDGKGHYASDWNYGSRDPTGSGSKWNDQRPWTQSWDRQNQPKNWYGGSQGDRNPLFGSSYPHTDRFPSSSNQPPYSTNSWHSSTSSYSPKPFYNYPTSSRPQSQYPAEPRPEYPVTSRPSYQSTQTPYPQQGGSSWNNRPGQWTTPRPNQNYLPQSSRPPTRPEYEYGGQRPSNPYEGTPGTAIWNGRPGSYDSRPGGPGARPPHGYYTGFITEIHDPHFNGGNRHPSDRPPGPGGSYNQDRYPDDRYPSSGYPNHDRLPDRYDKNTPSSGRPSYSDNHFPSGPDRYPSNRPGVSDRPYDGNRIPSYGPDDIRHPGHSTDHNRYPSQNSDRNKYPNYDSDRNPYPNTNWNQYGSDKDRDRYPNYYGDRDNNYPNHGSDRDSNRYPSSERDPNRYPSYGADRDSNRYPGYGSDRDSNRQPGYGHDRDRYPSRPGSSDHDQGPNPGSDSGSWNYGENDHKDGTYRRSGGSYPPYKGGQYFTSSYLASASTPAASSQELENKKGGTDETTVASSQEQ